MTIIEEISPLNVQLDVIINNKLVYKSHTKVNKNSNYKQEPIFLILKSCNYHTIQFIALKGQNRITPYCLLIFFNFKIVLNLLKTKKRLTNLVYSLVVLIEIFIIEQYFTIITKLLMIHYKKMLTFY